MRFDIKEFGLDPKAFLEVLGREFCNNSHMPCQSKAPLQLLANMVITEYDVALDRSLIGMGAYDKAFWRGYLPRSAERIKAELGVEVDNVFPYILQATIFSELRATEDGNPQGIFHCVEDVVNYQLFSKPNLASSASRSMERMDPELRKTALEVMGKVAATAATAKISHWLGGLFAKRKAELPLAAEVDKTSELGL